MADFRLTQTGEQIQAILNQQPLDHTALDGHIENSVIHVTSQNKTDWNAKYNKPSGGIPESDFTKAVQKALTAALSAYQKPNDGIPASDLAAAVQSAIAKANSAYQKPGSGIPSTDFTTAVQNALTLALSAYQKPNTGIPLADLTASVQAAINTASQAGADIAAERAAREQAVSDEASARIDADATLRLLIQQVSAQLVNYYLKTETYSKVEVNQIVDNVRQFQYKVVTTLPTASADTVGYKYLVPSENPKTKNHKEEYITISEQSGGSTTYSWEHIGSTNIDLSGYSTTEQMNAAIANALANYYTKAQVDSMVQSINAEITAAKNRIFFIEKSFGKYDGERKITLSQAKADKYVNVNGGETSASGYGISAPITLNAGDILLIPSTQAVPASVSVVARMVDRTYQKVIAYIYTYREDYPELPATATADYDSSLVYTAVYDESGDTPVLTGWTRNGETYATLPATREVSEQFYEPLVRQAVSAMPSTGYYIYLSPTAMTVVVSGLTATVSGGTALVVGWGIFKNITTNFVGAPGQSVLAQAFAVLFAAIDGLKAQLENLGNTKAVSIDFEEQPKLCGQDMHLTGEGAPASPNVPTMVGQEYLDVTNNKCYKAFRITNSVSDWVLLN